MNKEKNFFKRQVEMSGKVRQSRASASEIIKDFLDKNPDEWFFVWELSGRKLPLGWVSHKADNYLSKMRTDKLIIGRDVDCYVAYSSTINANINDLK